MATPTIVFNAASGSDTAASGAGPATALFGTAASTTAASADVTLSVDAPDLSGVAVDGSACMWVDSTSGRQFSKITAVNNGTKVVTCEDTFANTEGTRNWGIGGKRKLFDNADSATLYGATGAKTGWIVEFEDTQSLSAVATINTALDGVTFRGSSSTVRTITQSANVACFASSGADIILQYLKFQNTNVTKTFANGVAVTASCNIRAERCIFGDVTNTLLDGIQPNPKCLLIACDFIACTNSGVFGNSAVGWNFNIYGCFFRDCDEGVNAIGTTSGAVYVHKSVFSGCTNQGVIASTLILTCQSNTVNGSGSDGIRHTHTGPEATILNNSLSNNGGYGLNFSAATNTKLIHADFNNYYLNTSGRVNGHTDGANDLTLNPQYVDAAGENFEIGTNLKAQGFPDSAGFVGAGSSATNAFEDMGGAQREESGAGGGTVNLLRGKIG